MFKKEIIAVALMFLTACGWKPVYYQSTNTDIKTQVVDVMPVPNEMGRILTQKLKDILNPKDADSPKTFALSVFLSERLDTDQGIVGDNTSTRATMRIVANFTLLDKNSGKVVLNESTFAVSSYNILRMPYPTVTAEQATRKHLINVIAEQIGTRVAVYFDKE